MAAFTKLLALEMAPDAIRANAIAPGAIHTPMPRQLPGCMQDDLVEQALIGNPLQRIGTPRDVANLIIFLLSTRSAHITGQVPHINGGTLMP